MATLKCITAGESHGPALLTIVQGMPAGIPLDTDLINRELARRQGGYGRGARQKIETDKAEFLAGVRLGHTIGAPLAVRIANRDSRLDDQQATPPVHRPRPGHADLAGAVKRLDNDCRETLERASARETAARVAAGAVARCLLQQFDIRCFGFVRSIGDVTWDGEITAENLGEMCRRRDASEVFCPDENVSRAMIDRIRSTTVDKDTIGGLVETHIFNCPVGLGSCAWWEDKLDARLAGAVMGIQAFKAVEIGLGKDCAFRPGSQVHDPIQFSEEKRHTPMLGYTRPTNNAGGLEGGMTNGQPVVVRGAMKPISTLLRGLPSIDLRSLEPQQSQYERSDVCAVPAASVVMENVAAFEIARAMVEKFAGDSLREMKTNYDNYLNAART